MKMTTKSASRRIRFRFAAVAAAMLGLSLAPEVARAQQPPQCPPPSPQDCIDPAWAQTPCGAYEAQLASIDPNETCNRYIDQEVMSWLQQTGPQQLSYDYRVVPDGMFNAGQVAWTALVPSSDPRFDYFGQPSSYSDHLRRKEVAAVNPQSQAAMELFWYTSGWDQNGNAVGSCTEYVYEKWYGFSRYRDDAAALATDYRAIYNRAIRVPDGINTGPIRSRDGTAQLPVAWPTDLIPKSSYYLFEPTPWDRFPMDPSIIPNPAGAAYYHVDWGFHGLMSGAMALAGKTDAEMYDMDKRQDSFRKLLALRAKVIAELEKETYGSLTIVSVKPTAPELPVSSVFLPKSDFYSVKDATDMMSFAVSGGALEPVIPLDCGGYTGKMCTLYGIDRNIARELGIAHDKGCLDLYSASVCDWSPHQFVRYLDQQFVSPMESDFDRCRGITGDDFSGSSIARSAVAHGILGATKEDYTTSSTDLTHFFDLYETTVATLGFTPAPGSLTDGPVGWWRSGGDSKGSPDTILGSYHWDVGFGVRRNSTSSVAKCTADLAALADLTADVTVASTPHRIVDFLTSIESADTLFKAESHFTIGGKDVYPPRSLTTDLSFTVLDATAKDEQKSSGGFVIAGIPFTYTVGIEGEVGAKIDLGVALRRLCVTSPDGEAPTVDLTLSGTIKAGASVSVFAEGGVGVSKLGAGIKGSLTLLDVMFKPEASLSIHPAVAGDLESLVVDMTISLTKAFGAMGGKITAFVDLGFELEATLATWDDVISSSTTDSTTIHEPLNKIWSKL